MLWTALILGLLGSFHCVGMCGPIAFLLPLDRTSASKRVLQLLSYHGGRLMTYGAIGALLGILGSSIHLFGMQQQLSIAIGILMIAAILLPSKITNRFKLTQPIYKAVAKLRSAMGTRLKQRGSSTFITMGVLNGLLPCGLVYMAVFGAMASPSIGHAGLYMVFFGIGTIPLMTTAIYMGNFLKGQVKRRILKVIPVFVIIMGVLFILRGMGLGIKYISPTATVPTEQITSQINCH